KKKPVLPKQSMPPRPVQKTSPAVVNPAPKVIQPASQSAMPRRPQYIPTEPVDEGNYAEPMAGTFASEGSLEDLLAGAFATEGSVSKSMADDFANEGSMIDKLAASFASEGVSSFHGSTIEDFVHDEISDSEISDAPDYDYNAAAGGYKLADGFDVKKAVIYSAVLARKEYSY
ncbi:MAG TPA: hypothetical protein VLR72_00825, partial [Clostridiaceae bacterium]|nr:hypothetical protein [Clostridiaceae bacterium]